MKNVERTILQKVAKGALTVAKKEADSACFCFCYQPVMPKAVKELGKRK